MKILWICSFSNPQVRKKIHFSDFIYNAFYYLVYKQKRENSDRAAWITNGILEFEEFKEIELHVISRHFGMKYKTEEFEMNGIHYHFFKPEDDSFFKKTVNKFLKQSNSEYKRNRKIVRKLIRKIDPDLIHLFGAENPDYSITALDIDVSKTPLLVSLQTLMSDPDFISKYPISLVEYQHRSEIEREILRRTKYIGSTVSMYRKLIWESINPNVIFLNTTLAVAENVIVHNERKIFDFVYLAVDIIKAVDVAIEAFAEVCKKHSSITLNIIGGATPSFRKQLEDRIIELGIEKNIIFSGKFPTHGDVLKQIQKSKYALLPLKIDHISGTIREAMYSGLPVVTTKTYGTPSLNDNRESVLISEQGDCKAMAENMIRLIEIPELGKKLKDNGLTTANERWNNAKIMWDQVIAYKAIYNHHHFNRLLPLEIGTSNPNIQ